MRRRGPGEVRLGTLRGIVATDAGPGTAPGTVRASLLTGLHPHQTGIGILTYSNGPEGYAGDLNKSCVTVAEVLKQKNYKTYLSGKWHISSNLTQPADSWPTNSFRTFRSCRASRSTHFPIAKLSSTNCG